MNNRGILSLVIMLIVALLLYIAKIENVLLRFPKLKTPASVNNRVAHPNSDVAGAPQRTIASSGLTASRVSNWKEGMVGRTLEKMDVPLDNINVAVFTCQVHWLFKMNLLKRPTVYRCPHTRRTITVKSAYYTVNATRGADVVIFSAYVRNLSMWREVIAQRSARQIWVYSTEDSAFDSPQVIDNGTSVGFGEFQFNMSFGYHSMFDIYAPYGAYVEFHQQSNKIGSFQLSRLKQKTKVVAWIASNCNPGYWNRSGFVHELSKFLPVDKYGRCGNLSLGWGTAAKNKIKSYRFVLALENSCCTEYISEKFWRSLAEYETVPVVVGASKSEYENVAPPNSFIHADDFETLSDLAEYLREVANDDELYSKFHHWRLRGEAELHRMVRVLPFTSRASACALLKFLEERAWRPSRPLVMKFDPHGRDWLGSSESCGVTKPWLKGFDLATNGYRLRGEFKLFPLGDNKWNRVNEHRRKLAQS